MTPQSIKERAEREIHSYFSHFAIGYLEVAEENALWEMEKIIRKIVFQQIELAYKQGGEDVIKKISTRLNHPVNNTQPFEINKNKVYMNTYEWKSIKKKYNCCDFVGIETIDGKMWCETHDKFEKI